MSTPLNAMELVNAYQLNQVRIAAQEDEMRRNAMMDPYRAELLQTNAMGNRADIDYKRNALAFQERRAADDNLLRRDSMEQGNALRREAIGSRERTMENAMAARERMANRPRQQNAPAGYRYTQSGALEAIPGGPAEPKLGESQVKQKIGVDNTRDAIGQYRDALKNFGYKALASPDGRAQMGTYYNNMMLQAKEAYNLGVLNGPDYEILQKVVTDPVSWRGAITSNSALDAQAQHLDSIMEKIGSTVSSTTKRAGAPAQPRQDGGGGLQPGSVKGGYRFKGGNPADKNSWEKL